MAIRTLGESKDKKAVDALTPLLASKEMFEADYAAVAIAAIEGKKTVRPVPDAAARAAELNRMPESLGVVTQAVQLRPAGPVPSVDEMLKTLMPLERRGRTPQDQFVKGAIMVARDGGKYSRGHHHRGRDAGHQHRTAQWGRICGHRLPRAIRRCDRPGRSGTDFGPGHAQWRAAGRGPCPRSRACRLSW